MLVLLTLKRQDLKKGFLKTAFYGLNAQPKPEPELVKSLNRNQSRSKKLRFRNIAFTKRSTGNYSRETHLVITLTTTLL